jgi:hypothetical protein
MHYFVFRPYPHVIPEDGNHEILRTLTTPGLPTSPVKPFTIAEVQKAILNQRTTKSPGYDLINGKVLHELPEVGVVRSPTYTIAFCGRGTSLPNGRSRKLFPSLNPGNHQMW